MGSWGTGPTESDAALDYIGGVRASLSAENLVSMEESTWRPAGRWLSFCRNDTDPTMSFTTVPLTGART